MTAQKGKKIAVIIPAAGKGQRLGAGKNKALVELAGVTILERTLSVFSAMEKIGEIIVAVAAGEVEEVAALFAEKAKTGGKKITVIAGGKERQHSVANGLKALAPDTDIVLVHDAARCFVTPEVINRVIAATIAKGAAIAAVPAKNTIKVVAENGQVVSTPPRETLWEIQTPQGFSFALLNLAYQKAAADAFLGTDDASLVERTGQPVYVVSGDYRNIKITTPEDLLIAAAFLNSPARKADSPFLRK